MVTMRGATQRSWPRARVVCSREDKGSGWGGVGVGAAL